MEEGEKMTQVEEVEERNRGEKERRREERKKVKAYQEDEFA